jgi:glutamate synthase-like protein
MIIAKPESGTLLRWRDILKRLGGHQPRLTPPTVRRLDSSGAPAQSSRIEAPRRVAAACGWTEDQFKILFSALVHGKEADWSMGDDAPPAFLSSLPRTLWDYCKSLTRPSIPCARPT